MAIVKIRNGVSKTSQGKGRNMIFSRKYKYQRYGDGCMLHVFESPMRSSMVNRNRIRRDRGKMIILRCPSDNPEEAKGRV